MPGSWNQQGQGIEANPNATAKDIHQQQGVCWTASDGRRETLASEIVVARCFALSAARRRHKTA